MGFQKSEHSRIFLKVPQKWVTLRCNQKRCPSGSQNDPKWVTQCTKCTPPQDDKYLSYCTMLQPKQVQTGSKTGLFRMKQDETSSNWIKVPNFKHSHCLEIYVPQNGIYLTYVPHVPHLGHKWAQNVLLHKMV